MSINSIGAVGSVGGTPPPNDGQRWTLAQNLIYKLQDCTPLVRSGQITDISEIKSYMETIVSQVDDSNIPLSQYCQSIETLSLNKQLQSISGFLITLAPHSSPFNKDLANAQATISYEASANGSKFSPELTLNFEKILTIVHGMKLGKSKSDINAALGKLKLDDISYTQLDQNIKVNSALS